MTLELFASEDFSFASSRKSALDHLSDFVPKAGRYARDRNKVGSIHSSVSRLSPAIRHRLITEDECCEALRKRFADSTIEKFIQEVYWRRYWKSWLSLRPQVWTNYLNELSIFCSDSKYDELLERASICEEGKSSIAVMNYFARELISTGYLHNHARMWFAGWWIHVERLPWQLGADFFMRHLLDADPASNTLSWRWVAGLQTPGKTYLPRRSNIERYLDQDILANHCAGLDQLESVKAWLPAWAGREPVTCKHLPDVPEVGENGLGVWVHEEDMLPEYSPLREINSEYLLVAGNVSSWSRLSISKQRIEWTKSALRDTYLRATEQFTVKVSLETTCPLHDAVSHWAKKHSLKQVVAMRPEVGPLADMIPSLRATLKGEGVQLLLLDRSQDRNLRSFATDGFFGFWKRVCAMGV